MKTSRNRFGGLLFGLCALLVSALLPADAFAGEVLFRALGMEDTPSASAPTNTVSGTNHKYGTVDYAGTGTQLCKVVHFKPFSDYSAAGEFAFDFDYTTNGTSTNQSSWYINVGCPNELANATCTGAGNPRACCSGSGTGNCNNYDTITLSPGTVFALTPAIAGANIPHAATVTASNLANETGCSSAGPVIMQLCRDPAHASDTNTDTFKIIDMRVRW